MKVFLENDSSQPVVVGMNNELFSIFDKLPLETDYKKFFSDGLEDKKTSLRLLDGKYGNFCYCPDEFLAVSVSEQRNSLRIIYIPVYSLVDGAWKYTLSARILNNLSPMRDSYEKPSSAFARSVIKRAASFRTYQEVSQYLKGVAKSRQELSA